MKRIYTILALSAALLSGAVSSQDAFAQKNKAAKNASVTVELTILAEDGTPVSGAVMSYSEGALSVFSDEKGSLKATVVPGEVLSVKAEGFEDLNVAFSKNDIPDHLTLVRKVATNDGLGYVGAISTIGGRPMDSYSDLVYSNSLQGRLAGLVVVSAGSGLGNNVPSLYVRGLHRKSANEAIVLVDGMERAIDDIISEEVESISIMKDASAKILYGARAANGVISVVTRRGQVGKKVVNTSFESGVRIMTRVPEFLGSYDYATLFNEARANDGLPAFYSEAQLEGYRNSSGPNDILYPDIDAYDYFMRREAFCDKATVDMTGGNDRVQYSVVMNYISGNGFEKVGDKASLSRFNVRGNIDATVTDYMDIFVNLGARLEQREWGGINQVTACTDFATLRPNEYPLMIPANVLGLEPAEDGTPYFGASTKAAGNILADIAFGGFNSERYISSQADFGANLDFQDYVKGLKARAVFSIDNYAQFAEGQKDVYETYAIRGTSTDISHLETVKMRNTSLQANKSRSGATLYQTLAFEGNASYERTFGKNAIDLQAGYKYFTREQTGVAQNIRNDNTYLRAGYGFDRRYFVEGTAALMGSNRFAKGNRNFLSYSAGASWIISNEGFMQGCSAMDLLKLKASFGVLGYDGDTSFLLYNTRWANGSTIAFAEQNKTSLHQTELVRLASDLKWEYSREWNVGLEALMFGRRLSAEVNVFNEFRDNIITARGASVSSIVGDFTTSVNGGSVRNSGIDFDLSWADRKGDFAYEIGFNGLFSSNVIEAWNEIDYPDEGWKIVGKPTDAIFGYEAAGLFGKDVNMATAPLHTLGAVRDGDIAYNDLNGDNIIDERDTRMVGNSFPRVNLGLSIDLRYKGWELYALGTSALGVDNVLNNTYYWMSGTSKYSKVALDRYHPVNNPQGTYPALTTLSGSNNFTKSSFWIQDASFLRLKNVELSYTFLPAHVLKKIRLFARGTNLFVLSEMKDLDPETPNAGITSYPYYATVTGGVTLTF